MQNQTVVTNAFKGEDLNGYVPIFRHYDVPVRYNFRKEDMTWVPYQPKAKMLALDHIYPEGIRIPDYFIGKNIVHLPTVKTHMYTTTTGAMKNAFGGLLSKYRHYTHTWIHETLVDLLAIQKEIHPGIFAVMDGTTAGNGAGPAPDAAGGQECHPGLGRPGGDRRGGGQADGLRPAEHQVHPPGARAGPGRGRPARDRAGGRRRVRARTGASRWATTRTRFLAWLAWYGPTRVFQKLVLRTPLVVVPTFIGEVEQDYLYWPLKYQGGGRKMAQETSLGAALPALPARRLPGGPRCEAG